MKLSFEYIGNLSFFKNIVNSFLYFGASIIGLFVSIFSTPIFAQYMNSQDFSIIGYFTAIDSFLFPFYTLLFYSYYIANYFKRSEIDNKKILGSLIIFLFIWNILFDISVLSVLWIYFEFGNVSVPFFPYSIILLTASLFSIYRTFLTLTYRIKKNAAGFFLIMSLSKVLTTIASLVLVVYLNLGALGKLGGVLIGEIVVASISLYKLRNYISLNLNYQIIKTALKFSFPLILSSFPHLIIMNYDRILLEKINNVHEYALYNIGVTFSGYILLMGTSLFQAFEPDVYKYVVTFQFKKLFYAISSALVIFVIPVILFIVFSRQIFGFLTAYRYTMAYRYADLLSVAMIFYFLYSFLSTIILALDKSKIALYINAIIGIVAILLYNVFISTLSFTGAAYSKVILFFLITIAFFAYILKLFYNREIIR